VISHELDRPLHLGATVGLHQVGRRDPTLQLAPGELWWATRLATGPATLHVVCTDAVALAEAFGPGADEALCRVPGLLGQHDDPGALVPQHPVVADAAHRFPGLRMTTSGALLHALVPAILGQRVTGQEATRSWQDLCRRLGDPAPGPAGMLLPPDPARLAAQPAWWYHRLGIDRRRADTLRLVGARAVAIERQATRPVRDASIALASLPGVGAWTIAEVASRAFGDPDAVPVGDYHLPNVVSWVFAGEPRGTDERMLELLAPYAGQRGRVLRLLALAGHRAPVYGPRQAIVPIARL
jgi:3-methyladenine DNA glycosylase/8-oxoguanine DNA glycosylase